MTGWRSRVRSGRSLEVPGIDHRPDRQAIYDFAALFYIPAPETFYRGIRALQPGEILEASYDATASLLENTHLSSMGRSLPIPR